MARELGVDSFENAVEVVQVNAKSSRGRVPHEHRVSHAQAIGITLKGIDEPKRRQQTAQHSFVRHREQGMGYLASFHSNNNFSAHCLFDNF